MTASPWRPDPITCSNCPAEVLEAWTVRNERILLEPGPSGRGRVAAHPDGEILRARYLPKDAQPVAGVETRYVPHQDRCPGRSGGTAAWKTAEATQAAESRRGRGKHRGAHAGLRVGGFRVRPGRGQR